MIKKIKNLPALTAVKIISFILIPVLAFTILNRIFAIDMMANETRISPEVVLSDIPSDQHFFDLHMDTAYFHAMQVLYYGSEEAILSGEYLVWTVHQNAYELTTPDRRRHYARFERSEISIEHPNYPDDSLSEYNDSNYGPDSSESDYYYSLDDFRVSESENRRIAEQNAIREQLDEFRYSTRTLGEMQGLIYFLRRGTETVLSNAEMDAGFMREPVYLVMDIDSGFAQSHDYYGGGDLRLNNSVGGIFPVSDDMSVYLAFRAGVVAAHNDIYSAARSAYIKNFTIIAISAVLALLLLVTLLLGAGRKFAAGNTGGDALASGETTVQAEPAPAGRVHFTIFDRPFLDISLAALIGWTALMVFIFQESAFIWNTLRHQSSLTAMNIVFAAASAAFISPALLWLMSFTKHVKAGRFWRHTLIFFVPSRCVGFIIRYAKSMWIGFPLNAKVGLISFASFIIMLVMGFIGSASRYVGAPPVILAAFILTGAVTFLLLRYARRIYRLDQTARKISSGVYDEPAEAGGGELGGIAGSINNISAGINIAVEQRMKSERLKTELITNVSHDIRTPLTSIITYTDLLKNEGLHCEKASEYLDILIQKSQRLKTLTDELFEAAKAATGNIDVNLSDLDFVSLINQVLGELDSSVKSSGLDFRVDLPERLMVRADGRLMWRVLENLLSNIFRYSLAGSRVYLSARQENLFTCIELKNISAAELNIAPDELTDRFKRGDGSRSDGGSGLGLSIAQSFVAAQGGRFSISIDGDLFKASVCLGCR